MYTVVLDYQGGIITTGTGQQERVLTDGIVFEVAEKESLAVIGETGSGKTITALSIMGLLPANVRQSGHKICYQGERLAEPRRLRRLLGVDIVYIPQNGLEYLSPSKKIRYHLYDNLKKLGVRGKQLEGAAYEVLRAAGFEKPADVIDCYPFQLSGGMAQRVTLAISVCSRARLVIADEPTNGLDYASKMDFHRLLNELFPNASKIVITHDITVASFCDRILVLCGGKRMEAGKAADVLAHPHHPYTAALKAALVENGMQQSPVLRRSEGNCPFYGRCPKAQSGCKEKLKRCYADSAEWWCNGSGS